MFIGHFAVAFASKRAAPHTSLGWLIVAAQFPDVLWPVFLLFGWEHVRIDPTATRFTPLDLYDFPWSHSLVMVIVWATLFAGTYWAGTRYRAGAVILGFGVLSHWILDWIAHRPDLPIYPGGPRFGLSLWNSIPGTMIVELAMFAAGVWLYTRTTRPRDRIGRYGFAGFILLLLALYIGNRFSGPPPNVQTLISVALISVPLFAGWSWWFDRHRDAVPTQNTDPLARDYVSSV